MRGRAVDEALEAYDQAVRTLVREHTLPPGAQDDLDKAVSLLRRAVASASAALRVDRAQDSLPPMGQASAMADAAREELRAECRRRLPSASDGALQAAFNVGRMDMIEQLQQVLYEERWQHEQSIRILETSVEQQQQLLIQYEEEHVR